MNKFKVGDKVTAYGLHGEVSRIIEPINPYSNNLEVQFIQGGFSQWFVADGRADYRHMEPVLKHVVPPKKFVKKKLYVAVHTKPDRASPGGGHCVSLAYPLKSYAEGMFNEEHQVAELEITVEE